MLDTVQLPAGARLYEGPLPPILMSVAGYPEIGNRIDEHRSWSVPLPAKSLRSYPFIPVRNGFDRPGGGAGGTLTTPDGTAWLGGSVRSSLPLNVAYAQLNTAVTDDGHGGSIVRVDAIANWTPPKTKAELVPADDHAATITVVAAAVPPIVRRHVVVTDPKQFATVAAAFDRLRLAAVAQVHECGLLNVRIPGLGFYGKGTMVTEIAFSHDPASKPNLFVWTPTCDGVGVRANGEAQPTLSETDDFRNTLKQAVLHPA